MSDYAAFIPFVNRRDLLEKAIASAVDLKENLRIIDNSKSGLHGDPGWPPIIRPSVPMTFSQTLNFMLGLTKDKGKTICIWMHSDASAHPGSCLKLLELARRYTAENRKWGVLFTNYDALSAMSVEAFEKIGGWDEMFEWYASDCDAYYRLKLAGYGCINTSLPVDHSPSQTLNSDPEIRAQVEGMYHHRNRCYTEKWGGEPGHERYTTPFNR